MQVKGVKKASRSPIKLEIHGSSIKDESSLKRCQPWRGRWRDGFRLLPPGRPL